MSAQHKDQQQAAGHDSKTRAPAFLVMPVCLCIKSMMSLLFALRMQETPVTAAASAGQVSLEIFQYYAHLMPIDDLPRALIDDISKPSSETGAAMPP